MNPLDSMREILNTIESFGGSLSRKEIADLLSYSEQRVRGYLSFLKKKKVVVEGRHPANGYVRVYSLEYNPKYEELQDLVNDYVHYNRSHTNKKELKHIRDAVMKFFQENTYATLSSREVAEELGIVDKEGKARSRTVASQCRRLLNSGFLESIPAEKEHRSSVLYRLCNPYLGLIPENLTEDQVYSCISSILDRGVYIPLNYLEQASLIVDGASEPVEDLEDLYEPYVALRYLIIEAGVEPMLILDELGVDVSH